MCEKMLIDEELKLKNITLRNRIVMPPMAREGSADGKVTENLIEYYRLRAECTGLIIVEHAYVSIEGKSTQNSFLWQMILLLNLIEI